MFFKDVIGQEKAIEQIRNAIDDNTLPHALLIAGQEGFGGLTLALASARYLQCTNRHDGEACGTCPSCMKYNKLIHPDLHFIYPIINKGSSASSSISEDFLAEWRNAVLNDSYLTLNDWLQTIGADNKQGIIGQADSTNIIRHLCIKPYESDYRVIILWLPEKMNEVAANKLLKILEEPYEKTNFFLVSNEAESILGTILSRSQRLNLAPIQDADLVKAIVEQHLCEEQKAKDVVRLAQGSFVNARNLINDNEEQQFFFDKFCQMMRLSYGRKLFDMKAWSDEMVDIGRERQKNFLQYAQRMIRENYIMNLSHPELNYMTSQEASFSSRFARFVNERNVEGLTKELALAETDIMGNVSAKMVFFDLSLKLIMLLKQ